jgi:hypothetical protein
VSAAGGRVLTVPPSEHLCDPDSIWRYCFGWEQMTPRGTLFECDCGAVWRTTWYGWKQEPARELVSIRDLP